MPYLHGETKRTYIPDFIVQVDDGRPDPLNLIVEIKGFRGEEVTDKINTMHNYWVPGVNNLGTFGRWEFRQFESFFDIDADFNQLIDGLVVANSGSRLTPWHEAPKVSKP